MGDEGDRASKMVKGVYKKPALDSNRYQVSSGADQTLQARRLQEVHIYTHMHKYTLHTSKKMG